MPSSCTFTFDDPHAYGAAIRGVNSLEVLLTTKGKFQGELMQINLDRLWLQRCRENLPRILRVSMSADRSAIEFPIGTSQSRYRGIDVSPGEIVVHDSASVHRRTFASCHWGSMSLTPADLAATG